MNALLIRRTILGVAALLGAPTTVIAQSPCVSAHNQVVIDRSIVRTDGASDVLQLLGRQLTARRLLRVALTPDREPYIMIDGVGVAGGIQRLAEVHVGDVVQVVTLRPIDGALRFGTKGQHGAILVTTKSGRTWPCAGKIVPPLSRDAFSH